MLSRRETPNGVKKTVHVLVDGGRGIGGTESDSLPCYFKRFKNKNIDKTLLHFLITFYEFDNKDVTGFKYDG